MNRPMTLFCDIDGTLLKHPGTLHQCLTHDPKLLPGAAEFLQEVYRAGHRLILTTGRPECTRSRTEYQLKQAGIYYHDLIMGCTPGARIVINDGVDRAGCIEVSRNEGMNDEVISFVKGE